MTAIEERDRLILLNVQILRLLITEQAPQKAILDRLVKLEELVNETQSPTA
jgi:hypothetical protein